MSEREPIAYQLDRNQSSLPRSGGQLNTTLLDAQREIGRKAERAAIVAWLRGMGDPEFEFAARAIERGDHLSAAHPKSGEME